MQAPEHQDENIVLEPPIISRGTACRSCREMKIRCDRRRPFCTPCERARREDSCQYDDGTHKSKHRMLTEQVAALENRVRELEIEATTGPGSTPAGSGSRIPGRPSSPRRQPSNPHPLPVAGPSTRPTRSSSQLSPADLEPSAFFLPHGTAPPRPPAPPGSLSSTRNLSLNLNIRSPVDTPDDNPAIYSPSPQLSPQGQFGAAFLDQLKSLFIQHGYQLGPISGPSANPFRSNDPALRNAAFLIASFLQGSPNTPRFLSATLRSLSDSLSRADDLIDTISASGLLALYFYVNGRLTEGRYHSSAAVAMALQCRLHQIEEIDAPSVPSQGSARPSSSPWATWAEGALRLPPPRDAEERERRIRVFWQVFYLDRCWSVAVGSLPALNDGTTPDTEILTSWPGQQNILQTVRNNSLRRLYDANASADLPTNIEALQAQAAAVFERASRLAVQVNEEGLNFTSSDSFWTEFEEVELTITRLSAVVPPINIPLPPSVAGPRFFTISGSGTSSSSAPLPRDTPPRSQNDWRLILIHTLLHVSTIHLHHPFVNNDPSVHTKSLAAARRVLGIITGIETGGISFDMLDPILGTCWMSSAAVFIREMSAIRVTSSFVASDNSVLEEVEREFQTILRAMRNLAAVFPIVVVLVQKVEEYNASSF
ncbi:hypothetical protein SISSUDRAFT_1052871 [Sistotremastrum suecicum HHB10207 ss-3]|uniref:Zn(2)-C6 fungal-type domain-containing protein n=1 Tax=Sistotremastrum suecicum HHB10207 ss-3 TaxID=1314776 RepID=A0A165ZJY0_9AGAM|nr:hypothetical protein SISSUDRAFT_1052871 [Sistotremastrum suecicum HHB10207 ss-3]